MKNESGVEPLGRAVLVRYYEEPAKASSVIFIPETVQDRLMMLDQKAVVVQVGPACWPDEPQRAAPGDLVMIAKMSGVPMVGPADGKQYRMVNDRDIFARITTKE